VCLGDLHFLEENGFAPKVGDVIEVVGGYDGRVFVADSLSTGGRTLNLQGFGSGVGSSSHHSGHHCCDRHQEDDHHHCGHGDHHDGHE